MEENHAHAVLEKIKKEHIAPDTRLKVCWKSYAFWAVSIFMAVLGAIFFSLVLVEIDDMNGSVIKRLDLFRFAKIAFVSAPYLWIGLFVTALVVSTVAFRHTRRSYRFSPLLVVGIGIAATAAGAAVLHAAKMNSVMEDGFVRTAPFLSGPMLGPLEKRWSAPEEGLLGGRVEQTGSRAFVIFAFDGTVWTVTHSDQTEFFPPSPVTTGEMVRVIGQKKNEGTFHAEFVRHDVVHIRYQNTKPWRDCELRRKQLLKHMQTPHDDPVYTCAGKNGKLAPEGPER